MCNFSIFPFSPLNRVSICSKLVGLNNMYKCKFQLTPIIAILITNSWIQTREILLLGVHCLSDVLSVFAEDAYDPKTINLYENKAKA